MLRRDYMLVVDVEATCWKDGPPPGEQSEIIEIGVCLLDLQTGAPGSAHSLMVNPARSRVSPFCTSLTSITPEMVEQGNSFADACAVLRQEYLSDQRLWGSWGNYDRRMFEWQAQSYAVPYPFGAQHVNIKALFAETFNRQGKRARQVGMAQALAQAGLTLVGTHHRGGDDAANIARLMQAILNRRGTALLAVYLEKEPV